MLNPPTLRIRTQVCGTCAIRRISNYSPFELWEKGKMPQKIRYFDCSLFNRYDRFNDRERMKLRQTFAYLVVARLFLSEKQQLQMSWQKNHATSLAIGHWRHFWKCCNDWIRNHEIWTFTSVKLNWRTGTNFSEGKLFARQWGLLLSPSKYPQITAFCCKYDGSNKLTQLL